MFKTSKATRKTKMKYQQSNKGRKKHNAANKKYKQTIKGKAANKKYENKAQYRKYGLTTKQRISMYIKQNGCCYICRFPISYDDIKTDHNHKLKGIKSVRKLLCHRCNVLVGWVESSPELINPVLDYLEEHKIP